jgi:(p)ppGpp synthase/HD superfamily hydrolase
MSKLLEKAIQIACNAHAGQKRWNGDEYITHPLRVAFGYPHFVKDEKEQIVAILHDVIEDTSITLEDLRREGFPEYIVEAIDDITKRENESYEEDYLDRVRKNPIARQVKYADLLDNTRDRVSKKYEKAKKFLFPSLIQQWYLK